jgi:hypothetical protein
MRRLFSSDRATMNSTSLRSACDRFLAGIFASTKVLTYSSVPIADFFRQKDIELFKDELSSLSGVLKSLRDKDSQFPQALRADMVALIDECDNLRQQSQLILDRENGRYALSQIPDGRSTWLCTNRDEAFLLRHQIIQRRAAFSAALAVSKILSFVPTGRGMTYEKYVAERNKQFGAIRTAVDVVMGEDFGDESRGAETGSIAFREMRDAVLKHRDTGVTGPSASLTQFLADLFAFASGLS